MATLGIDIGTISLKLAIIGEENERAFLEQAARQSDMFLQSGENPALGQIGDRILLVSNYRRIQGSPVTATRTMLGELFETIPQEHFLGIRITGSGARLIGEGLGAGFENEFKAIALGIGALHPEVRTIFEMGGETSKFIQLDRDETTGTLSISDYETNGDCAAGTGSFMDQQATRLLYDIEDVGGIVMGAGKAATIAGRCSVFAKSDMIHAQQKGYQPAEILRGLCDAVIRNYKGTITKGKKIEGKVAFIGGVAANQGTVQAMREAFELDDDDFLVPPYYAWMGAIGAALLEAEHGSGRQGAQENAKVGKSERETLSHSASGDGEWGADFPTMAPLSLEKVTLLRDRIKPYRFKGDGRVDAYLGIDVGSVSTNLVVIDEDGDVIKEIYTKTDARPIEVVNKGLQEIAAEIGSRIAIRGVGTTGSGRELIGELTGADTIKDEITAHKTGAMYIGKRLIDKEVDTIFEIGGQDSKFISIQDGVVVDFAMNDACAAGTGSFLEEQAEKLQINIIGEFAERALQSAHPLKLGERCTVFMGQDVASYQQRGASKEDLVAGLAFSIVHNYLNRVVRERTIGDVIYFQGGTAYNDSVAAAFSMVLDKEIIVPPHNGVVGAIGAALLAQEKVAMTGSSTRFRGYDLNQVNYTIREFMCKGCSNACDMREVTVDGEKTYWGDKCSDRYRKRVKVEKEPVIPDLMAFREQALVSAFEEIKQCQLGRGKKIGLARSMYMYDRLPFWSMFLSELGFEVVLSDPTDRKIRDDGVEATVAEPCFPIRVAHGHIQNLLDKGVDYLFHPNVLNEETDNPDIESHVCAWGQTLPYVLRRAPHFEPYMDRFLVPTIHFRRGLDVVKQQLCAFFRPFGIPKNTVHWAVGRAYAAQSDFRLKLLAAGQEALALIEKNDELGVVLIGRPYNVCDKGVNMDIPRKLRKYYGVNVIPMDFLPSRGIDISDINDNMFWNYGRKILQTARIVGAHPNLHIIYITNFKCGPDSYIRHFVRDASGNKPFLSLQFDEHSNDAGAMTRCEAYLDSKGFLRWWVRKVA
ncbi:MAG: acyl-CoA dehydratase activase [Candidatus Latescibacterota bacterium]